MRLLIIFIGDLTKAIDSGRIHFDNVEDGAQFHADCLQQLFDGEAIKVDLKTKQ